MKRLMLAALLSCVCVSTSFAAKPAAAGKGRFKVQYSAATTADNKAMAKMVKDSKSFDQLAEAFNKMFTLPKDIIVHFKEDDSGNAPFYLDGEIVMNYEFLVENSQMFAEYEDSDGDKKVEARKEHLTDQALDDKVLGVAEFVFYHELGHALVDLYGLPVVGKEEDAVDTLAAIVSTDVLEEGESALAAAESYSIYATNRTEFEDADFYDEHSLDEQRFYSVVCIVYGSDPDKYKDLLKQAGMPEDRAETCQVEHDSKVKAWQTLLAPHMTTPIVAEASAE